MYVRRKKNRSGSISVQVIDKSSGTYKVVHSLGSSFDISVVKTMEQEAYKWIKDRFGQLEFNFDGAKTPIEEVLSNIEQIYVCGTEKLLGKIFDEIGFDAINKRQEQIDSRLLGSKS